MHDHFTSDVRHIIQLLFLTVKFGISRGSCRNLQNGRGMKVNLLEKCLVYANMYKHNNETNNCFSHSYFVFKMKILFFKYFTFFSIFIKLKGRVLAPPIIPLYPPLLLDPPMEVQVQVVNHRGGEFIPRLSLMHKLSKALKTLASLRGLWRNFAVIS